METTYRHKVRWANEEYAVLDVSIEQIALYDNGRYLGLVDRIPEHLATIEATVFRNGDIAFDRDVFLVGDRREGFELISTPFQDGYVGSGRGWDQDMSVGRVYLRSGEVVPTRYSRLFSRRSFKGFAPISLLPEDEGWLWDFGAEAISAERDDYGAYYGYSSDAAVRFQSSQAYEAESRYDYDTEFGASFSVDRKASIRRVE